jgi:hypothetical protein
MGPEMARHENGNDPPERAAAQTSPAAQVAEVTPSVTGYAVRRAAALRTPPLGDGPADPLGDLAGLPIRPYQPCAGAEFTSSGWRPCCGRGAA